MRQRLRELAAERRRFGYRRLGWMLAREGHALNHKKLYRLYREERLMVRRRRGRKRALGTRAPMTLPSRINQFSSLGEARAIIEAWRHDYNHLRPQSSLGYLAPEEFAARNQGSSAIARTAWPAELAGAVQGAPTSDPKPDSFSAALRE